MASYIKKTDKKKPWAIQADVKRNVTILLDIKKTFLIYCEGTNTEPEYFRSFPVTSETRIEAFGLGRSRLALVQHVIQILTVKEFLINQKNYDEDRKIWCVFDKDIHHTNKDQEDQDFNSAIDLAEANGLNVAYSNDSFELWFFLHDNFVDTQLNRTHYFEFLSKKFKINYEEVGKTLEFSKSLYALFLSTQKRALINAKRLYDSHNNKGTHCQKNPCTTVFKLVNDLNECLKGKL